MPVPLLDLTAQHAALQPRLRQAVDRVISSGRLILGPEVEAFEAALAASCGARYAVGVSSGTDALIASLMALEIGPGDEVIVPAFTFVGTAGSVALVGATPVFTDIDADTYNMDPDRLEQAVTGRTRAVVPVHLYGQTADMDAIAGAAARHGLKLVEDAAQSIGARQGDRPAGAVGDVGCLSFYPSKNLAGPGDSGACLTGDPDVADRLRSLRVHGDDGAGRHLSVGGNFRIDALAAAVLRVKIEHLDRYNEARRAHASRYDRSLGDLPVGLPRTGEDRYHVYNQYTIRVPDGRRDALAGFLDRRSIGHRVYYPVPLHLQPCFAHLGGKAGEFPEAERACAEVLSVPVYPELSESQQDEVIDAIRSFFEA